MDVVGNHRHDRYRGSFQDLNTWRTGIDIDHSRCDIDCRSLALTVECEVVHDLQTCGAISDKSNARAKRDAVRISRQYESGNEAIGVERIRKIHHVQSQRHCTATARATYCDTESRAIRDDRLARDRVVIHTAEFRQIIRV